MTHSHCQDDNWASLLTKCRLQNDAHGQPYQLFVDLVSPTCLVLPRRLGLEGMAIDLGYNSAGSILMLKLFRSLHGGHGHRHQLEFVPSTWVVLPLPLHFMDFHSISEVTLS